MPIDDPPLAGLTNTGQPSSAISSSTRLRSASPADGPQSLSRTTTYRPMGSPRAANSSFMYSLSMPAALASTPAPAYLIPAISSSPWIVPSSPKVPCSSGSTTSTSPSSGGTAVGPLNTSPPPLGPAAGVTDTPGVATASTDGEDPDDSASRAGSAEVSTHRPSRAIPIGTTSYRSGSMPPRISPALAHDTACSLLRPPNTTATRILRAGAHALPPLLR